MSVHTPVFTCVCLCMQAVAELLTTDKLSELACVTLYMMYEKMNGKKSRWHHYIKELDRCGHSLLERIHVTKYVVNKWLNVSICILLSAYGFVQHAFW